MMGPSSNRWPRWPSHFAHLHSVPNMKLRKLPFSSLTLSSTGSQNEGQPVPESYFVSVRKRTASQPLRAQTKSPLCLMSLSGDENAGSVPPFEHVPCQSPRREIRVVATPSASVPSSSWFAGSSMRRRRLSSAAAELRTGGCGSLPWVRRAMGPGAVSSIYAR